MSVVPRALRKLIDEFGVLPGVGARTAERYAYNIVKSNPAKANRLSKALSDLHESIKQCPVTFALIEANQDVSPLYSDESRDKSIVAVVEDPLDIVAIEKTNQFKGTYHVLGGLLSPMQGVEAGDLHLKELNDRIKSDKVTEVILAISASVEGETTSLYIQKQIGDEVKITKLARGIPAGLDIDYADQTTLTQAFEQRREF